MATCPKCGTTLKDEYGMSQCPSCGTFSFIDMDGTAVLSEPEDQPADFEQPAPEFLAPFNSEQPADFEKPAHPEPSGAAAPSEFGDPIEDIVGASAFDFQPDQVPVDFGRAGDPLNVNEFANSELSSAKDGPFHFRILISGIDTKEIRESIREVIEDSRFAWDSKEIFSKISHGNLAIDGLSPVKASILVTRMKRLPVKIRWEQYAITQGPKR